MSDVEAGSQMRFTPTRLRADGLSSLYRIVDR
jgi:hypothetical protein